MSSPKNASLPSSHPPSTTALLVCDYHTMIVGMIQDEAAKKRVVSSAKTLITAARDNGVFIVHCLINTAGEEPLSTSKAHERWSTMYKPSIAANPSMALEHPELAPPQGAGTAREVTVARRPGRISALTSDGIKALLKDNGITSLVVCGLSTSGCVLSTTRHASDEDFVVTVVEDACADNKEDVHKTLFKDIFPTAASVMGLDEAVALLGGK
ncbi:putative hydrolase protein [Mycena galericulata]|nr:putative hydrolase protein [Mycena galericulata]